MSDALARTLYNTLLPLAAGAAHVSSWFLPKMRAAIVGRRGYRHRWETLSQSLDGASVWFHVSSVGEFEQARPVITAIAREHPGLPVVLTFSSPSGYDFAQRKEKIGAGQTLHFVDYLPADFSGAMKFCLDCAKPRLLVLVKFDLWPNLIWEAKRRDIPTVLIDATLSPSSKRLTGPGRAFYRSIYSALDHILAISTDDADRFQRTLPGHEHIAVTGDTRFDRVMERWQHRAGTGVDLGSGDGQVIIAGSTWPRDEAHLLGALRTVLSRDASRRLIIAPHEPSEEHLRPLEQWAGEAGLSCRRATQGPGGTGERVVIIDTVGILAEAYRLGNIAFIGGAFSTGVHSVIEPAIAGLPVLFGPLHDNSFEALQLIERGGGFAVASEDEITARIIALLDDPAALAGAGAAAREYVETQLGATEKCMEVIRQYL